MRKNPKEKELRVRAYRGPSLDLVLIPNGFIWIKSQEPIKRDWEERVFRKEWETHGILLYFLKEVLPAGKAQGEYVKMLLKDYFFLFKLGHSVSMDSSILTHWVNQGKFGMHPKAWCSYSSDQEVTGPNGFSSLGCMNRLPIHGTQGPGSRLAIQDMAEA